MKDIPPCYTELVEEYLKEYKRTTDPEIEVPEITFNSGWFSIRGNKMRAVEFANCLRRLKDRRDWKAPLSEQLDYPDFNARKALRVLRTKIAAEAPYIKKEAIDEWVKGLGCTALDLIRLILNQD